MLVFRRIPSALLGAALLSLVLLVSPAAGAGPATVTVRVVGSGAAFPTLLPLTEITTTNAPIVKDGGSCSGTSAAGALELATKGNWEGHWNSGFGDYEVLSVEGQGYPFEAGSKKNYFWSFWLNNREATTGVCGAQLETGNQVLFFPGCFGSECPTAPNVLAVEMPTSAEVGSVSLRVVSYPSAGGEPSPVSGATVSGEGVNGKTDSSGHATFTFSHGGRYILHVTGPAQGAPSVPAEAATCIHAGNDGTCGTKTPTVPSTGQTRASGGVSGFSNSSPAGPFAVVARATGPIDGHVYSRRHAPRVLTGTVLAHSILASVSIELHRSYRGRCYAYDGTRERFIRARCGRGRFFKVSTKPSFSYLLPSSLPPGRYVFDIKATDTAGNHTTLARGTSRIVFYVG